MSGCTGNVAGVRMNFDVGTSERHRIDFAFDKVWGFLSIKVDGRSVVRTIRVASIGTVKTWEFAVGSQERHVVRIEKHRERILAAFRPQQIHAYVDGQHVASGVA
jgi:hypothetical protein